MYAIEFEADIRDGIVKIPAKYRELDNSHARIILMVKENQLDSVVQPEPLDLSDCHLEGFEGRDAVETQREMRDEW